jgi:hypothetical protein
MTNSINITNVININVLCDCCEFYGKKVYMQRRMLSEALGRTFDPKEERDEEVYECDVCGNLQPVNDGTQVKEMKCVICSTTEDLCDRDRDNLVMCLDCVKRLDMDDFMPVKKEEDMHHCPNCKSNDMELRLLSEILGKFSCEGNRHEYARECNACGHIDERVVDQGLCSCCKKNPAGVTNGEIGWCDECSMEVFKK